VKILYLAPELIVRSSTVPVGPKAVPLRGGKARQGR